MLLNLLSYGPQWTSIKPSHSNICNSTSMRSSPSMLLASPPPWLVFCRFHLEERLVCPMFTVGVAKERIYLLMVFFSMVNVQPAGAYVVLFLVLVAAATPTFPRPEVFPGDFSAPECLEERKMGVDVENQSQHDIPLEDAAPDHIHAE